VLQSDRVSPGVVVPGSSVEVYVVNADDGVKLSSNAQTLDVLDGSSEATVTNESLMGLSLASDGSVLPAKPGEPSTAGATKTNDAAEQGTCELSSQESSVTRTRSRDVMDFEHLKMKLVELTGPSKDTTAAAGGKAKPDTDEPKDVSLDSGSAALNVTSNSVSQVNVCRQTTDQQATGHRVPSVSPEPNSQLSGPVQPASQQASQHELPVTTSTQQDHVPAAAAKTVPSTGDQVGVPVHPVKPVPVYPSSMVQPVLATGPVGLVNGSATIPLIAAAMTPRQYQTAGAEVDGSGGFVPVQQSVVGDMAAASSPASPDGVTHMVAPPPPQQQPTAADYSQAALLALYNQMMMSLPLMASAWPPLGYNPFLVAANPMIAAQMMYGAPLMSSLSEPLRPGASQDAVLGVQGFPVVGQVPQQAMVPGVVHGQVDQSVRPAVGLVPSSVVSLASTVLPVAATRPVTPRLPVPLAAHEHHPAGHAAGMHRKRVDLANLEEALIAKLGPPRKPVPASVAGQTANSPPTQSLPGAMAWFPMPYGHPAQHSVTPTAVSSPVVSPLFNTDMQLPVSVSGLTTDTAVPTLAGLPLTGTAMYSGRTTPSVAAIAESLPTAGKLPATVTLPSAQQPNSGESVEAVAVSASDEQLPADLLSLSAGQLPSKRKLQFTVSAVKDDPLSVIETLSTVSEPAVPTSDETTTSSQIHEPAAVSAGKASVKRGRFRICDVKEGVMSGVGSCQQESGSQLQESVGGVITTSVCVTSAGVVTPEQVKHRCSHSQLCWY